MFGRGVGPTCLLTIALGLLTACPKAPSGSDAGTQSDAATVDSGSTPGPDAGRDAGVDAGPKIYPPVSADVYCAQRAQAYCSRAVRCSFLDPADQAACVSTDEEICGISFLGAAAAYGRITFDSQTAGNCVGMLGDDSCKSEHLPAPCKAQLATGLVTDGGCFKDFECAKGSFCNVPFATCSGSCVAYIEAVDAGCDNVTRRCDPTTTWCDFLQNNTCQPLGTATGQDGGPSDCFGLSTACATGSPCQFSDAGSWKCLAVAAAADLGGACTFQQLPGCLASPATFDSVGELYCRADSNNPKGTCEPQIPEGSACTQITQYESDPIYDQCEPGLVCNAFYATGTCEKLSGDGQACDNFYGCKWSRNPSDYVDYRSADYDTLCDSSTRVCTYYPGPGESCDTLYQCSSSAWCDFSSSPYTCQPKLTLGQSCAFNDQECISGRCGYADGGFISVCLPPCAGDPDAGYFEDAGVVAADAGVDSGFDAGTTDAGLDGGLDGGGATG